MMVVRILIMVVMVVMIVVRILIMLAQARTCCCCGCCWRQPCIYQVSITLIYLFFCILYMYIFVYHIFVYLRSCSCVQSLMLVINIRQLQQIMFFSVTVLGSTRSLERWSLWCTMRSGTLIVAFIGNSHHYIHLTHDTINTSRSAL